MRPLFAILPVALFLVLATGYSIRSGVQLEDSGFMVLRAAENLRLGDGPVFNPGEKRDLVDSPLWLGLLTLLSFSSHAPFLVQVLGLGFGVAALLAVLAAPRLRVAGACASLFVALDGLFAVRATTGGSAPLAALYLVFLYRQLRSARGDAVDAASRDRTLAFWVALGPLVRYEFAFVAVVATFAWALADRRRLGAWLPLGSSILASVVVLGLRWRYFQSLPAHWEPWPPSVATFFAGAQDLGQLLLRRPLLLLGVVVMIAGWIGGTSRIGRTFGLTLALFALALFSVLPAGGSDFERHMAALLPVGYLLAIESVWRGARTRFGLVAALLLVVAQPAATWPSRSHDVETVKSHTRLGQWLRSRALPGTVLGARQAGALGYFSRLQVEDVLGVVSRREATAQDGWVSRGDSVRAIDFAPMLRQEPDLVLVGPGEPEPPASLYVPDLDAVPEAIRGSYRVYRWAASTVWRDRNESSPD